MQNSLTSSAVILMAVCCDPYGQMLGGRMEEGMSLKKKHKSMNSSLTLQCAVTITQCNGILVRVIAREGQC